MTSDPFAGPVRFSMRGTQSRNPLKARCLATWIEQLLDPAPQAVDELFLSRMQLDCLLNQTNILLH